MDKSGAQERCTLVPDLAGTAVTTVIIANADQTTTGGSNRPLQALRHKHTNYFMLATGERYSRYNLL